jgi:hypothetical protein
VKALFNYIKARINTNIPTIKTVRMFNNQFLHSNGNDNKTTRVKGYRDEKAFAYPACFVEFIVEQSDNRCLGIVDYILTVRFRFGIEAYKFERLDSFDFADTFKSYLQLMAPTVASGLTFTTFQEISTEFDEDHDNVESPYIDYRTRYRSSVAYQRRTDVIASPTDIVIEVNQTIEGLRTTDLGLRITDTGDFRLIVTT